MSQSIFSTYSQGENRVTATLIEVLRNLPVNVVERFLSFFDESQSTNFFTFENQVTSKTSRTVPDAVISSNFNLIFETKVVREAINEAQLKGHIELAKINNGKLIYLTPDTERPALLKEDKQDNKQEDKIGWKSFHDLNTFIDELMRSEDLILSERDQFLLKNLQIFFAETGLLPVKDEVVIVAAKIAWPAYEAHGVYVCQAGRSFKKVDYLGFYADGEIKSKIAKIKSAEDVSFPEKREDLPEDTPNAVKSWLDAHPWGYGRTLKVFILSKNTEADTQDLLGSITNDLKNDQGRSYAYTQGQRYTSLEKLKNAKSTNDL